MLIIGMKPNQCSNNSSCSATENAVIPLCVICMIAYRIFYARALSLAVLIKAFVLYALSLLDSSPVWTHLVHHPYFVHFARLLLIS